MSIEQLPQSSSASGKVTPESTSVLFPNAELQAIQDRYDKRKPKPAERPSVPVSSIDGKGMGLSGPGGDRPPVAAAAILAYRDAALVESRKAQDQSQSDRLWRESQVPARHGVNALMFSRLFPPGDRWGETRLKMDNLLGTGFLVGFLGGRGPGKTQLAVDLVKIACNHLKTSRYAKAMDFFLDVRATYGTNDSERGVIATYVKYDLLVLDEIGVQAESPFEGRLLAHLIDKRYDAMKDTILISNLLPKEFKKTVGKSIHDRLAETGTIEEFNWASHRPATAEGVKGC